MEFDGIGFSGGLTFFRQGSLGESKRMVAFCHPPFVPVKSSLLRELNIRSSQVARVVHNLPIYTSTHLYIYTTSYLRTLPPSPSRPIAN